MKKQSLFIKCGALLVFGSVLLVSGLPRASAQAAAAPGSDLVLHIRDYCDPTSFDIALNDPNACNRDITPGAITFQGFVAELSAEKSVGAWRFSPEKISAAEGATLHVTNLGGETHTFTQVKDFGGGFVGFLNAASGNPTPAPECAQIVNGQLVPQPPGPDNTFLPAGATTDVSLDQEVSVKYQCCIHPWMRLTISPRNLTHNLVR